MMETTSYSEYIGDGVVKRLEVDFKAQRITLELERWHSEDEAEHITAVFSGVQLQEFWDFNHTTVLMDLEEASSAIEFMDWHADYFQRMKKYLPSGLVQQLNADETNRFFSFTSICGFEGFIICRAFQLSNHLLPLSAEA